MSDESNSQRELTPQKGFLLFVAVLIGMLFGGSLLQQVHMQLGLILSEVLVVLLPALVFRAAFREHRGWPSVGSINLPGRWIAWVALTATLLGLAANLVTALIVELVPGFDALAAQYEEMVQQLLFPGGEIAILGAVAVTIAAPLCEEYLFRGVILPAQLSRGASLSLVIVTNGLLFSLLHVNPFGFVALAVVGMFFAHITVLSKSLWPAIIAHAVLNTVNGVLVPTLFRDSVADPVEPTLLEILGGCAIFVPLVAGAWYWGARRLSVRHDA